MTILWIVCTSPIWGPMAAGLPILWVLRRRALREPADHEHAAWIREVMTETDARLEDVVQPATARIELPEFRTYDARWALRERRGMGVRRVNAFSTGAMAGRCKARMERISSNPWSDFESDDQESGS